MNKENCALELVDEIILDRRLFTPVSSSQCGLLSLRRFSPISHRHYVDLSRFISTTSAKRRANHDCQLPYSRQVKREFTFRRLSRKAPWLSSPTRTPTATAVRSVAGRRKYDKLLLRRSRQYGCHSAECTKTFSCSASLRADITYIYIYIYIYIYRVAQKYVYSILYTVNLILAHPVYIHNYTV